MKRREFIGLSAAAAAMPVLGGKAKSGAPEAPIWADLVHLGHNMWVANRPYDSKLRCDDAEWRAITDRMAAVGMTHITSIVVDDGYEASRYPSMRVGL